MPRGGARVDQRTGELYETGPLRDVAPGPLGGNPKRLRKGRECALAHGAGCSYVPAVMALVLNSLFLS